MINKKVIQAAKTKKQYKQHVSRCDLNVTSHCSQQHCSTLEVQFIEHTVLICDKRVSQLKIWHF